jgi:hypothetical protein
MKLQTSLLSLLLVISLALVTSCGGGESTTPPQKVELGKLTAKTWTCTKATDVNGDRTSDFVGMKLKITGPYNSSTPDGPYSYEVSGITLPSPSPWPPIGETIGKWSFSSISSAGDQVLRDPGTADQVSMTFEFSGTKLIVKLFNITGDGWNNRTANVGGNWTFEFN